MVVTPWRPTIAVLSPNTATLALRRKRSTRSPTSSRTTRSHLRLGQAGSRRRARTRRSPAALFVPRHGPDDWNGQVAKPARVQSRRPSQSCGSPRNGFSLHAAVRWRDDQRKELEQLCRYITRPAIANDRLKRNRAGQVVLQLKSPYKDGTTHIVMEPLEFMERLAALVPRPRLHL